MSFKSCVSKVLRILWHCSRYGMVEAAHSSHHVLFAQNFWTHAENVPVHPPVWLRKLRAVSVKFSIEHLYWKCLKCRENDRNNELPIGMWKKSDGMNGRNLIACFRLGVWKLREKGRCPCVKKRTRHTYSLRVKKYENGTNFWKQNIFERNEEPADKKVTGSFWILELKTLGQFLCRAKCTWVNHRGKLCRV
jgi:hypothetical protein